MTNLQINKELIDKLLEQLEKDKMLEEYYRFIESEEIKYDNKGIRNKKEERGKIRKF